MPTPARNKEMAMTPHDALTVPPFPEFITLETVKMCNSRCVFCTIDQWPRHTPVMPAPLYDKIADDIIANHSHVKQLCLTGCGEPLLDKKLPERIYRFKKEGIAKVVIITNASLLSGETSLRLLDSGLDEIMITIDGLDPERYASLRVGLDLQSVMENVIQFLNIRDKHNAGTSIRMRMEAHPSFTQDDIDSWLQYWRGTLGNKDNVYAKKMHNWGNQIDTYASASQITSPCHVLWSTMNILSDGQVALCCIDFLPKHGMGSLATSSISEIWQGRAFNQAREWHASGQRDRLGLCSGCQIWESSEKIA